ncbi:MAG: hypothetical protein OEY89_18750, partial [Gammaproteobacteria bacterium]|nr:hypothetical protein [Gammaproteobacteria bacterium]
MKCLKLVIVATALVLSTSANAAIVRTTLEGVTIGDDIYNVTFIQESYADYLVEQENYYAGIEPYSGAPSFRNYNS